MNRCSTTTRWASIAMQTSPMFTSWSNLCRPIPSLPNKSTLYTLVRTIVAMKRLTSRLSMWLESTTFKSSIRLAQRTCTSCWSHRIRTTTRDCGSIPPTSTIPVCTIVRMCSLATPCLSMPSGTLTRVMSCFIAILMRHLFQSGKGSPKRVRLDWEYFTDSRSIQDSAVKCGFKKFF